MTTMDWNIARYRRGGEPEQVLDSIVLEFPLEIIVNGAPLVSLMRLPGMERELALGFCLTERIIDSVAQVRRLEQGGGRPAADGPGEDGGLDRASRVHLDLEAPRERERFSPTDVVRTGSGAADLSAIDDDHAGEIRSELRVAAEVIYGIREELTRRQDIFRGTGGTHGAGIFSAAGEVQTVAEDVGRHNALDKTVGCCALRGIALEDKILALSGRISYEMALKTIRARLPVIVSMAAPTSLGLRIAQAAGLTVVGFSDAKRFNVYTHGRRITP